MPPRLGFFERTLIEKACEQVARRNAHELSYLQYQAGKSSAVTQSRREVLRSPTERLIAWIPELLLVLSIFNSRYIFQTERRYHKSPSQQIFPSILIPKPNRNTQHQLPPKAKGRSFQAYCVVYSDQMSKRHLTLHNIKRVLFQFQR